MKIPSPPEKLLKVVLYSLPFSMAINVMSCAALSSPAAQSALDIIAPIAKTALTALMEKRGEEVDEDSAGCFDFEDLGVEIEDEDGFSYVLCRAKAVE